MCWTIEAALQSNKFDRVIVATDSLNYASIARDCGAEYDFLRDRYVDSVTPTSVATLYIV